jgi:rhodanese-related sulfurtransferase
VIESVPACELKKILAERREPVLVDVRTASEYAAGHVPGAINIPIEQIEARLDDLSPGSQIVLVCQSGGRARLAAALLKSYRTDVTVLDGGTLAWMNAGFPVVVNTNTRWALERQVRLVAGVIVVVASVLAMAVSPHWGYLAGIVGLGLTFAGLTGICPMASLLCKMPWNLPSGPKPAPQGATCSLRKVSSSAVDSETILS